MTRNAVVFAGAGPGAVDLLTLRCRDAIGAAEVIVYAGSLVNPDVLRFARSAAERHDSARMTLEETTSVMVTAYRAGKRVLRLHTGDPSVYGAINEQIAELSKAAIPCEVIPGVGAFSAAAASVGRELTMPGISQTVILTRRAGRTPVPEGQDTASLASHGATMALYLSVADMEGLVRDLRAGGYAGETPVVVVHRASWPDERIIRGTLDDIASAVAETGIRRQAVILVGRALGDDHRRSRLYAPGFTHGFRDGATNPPFLGRVAVHALTEAGCLLARHLGDAIGADVFVSAKHPTPRATGFAPSALGSHLRRYWTAYDAHVLVMATGIAVRKTAPLLRDKISDPALVVCDDRGRFAVSLAGGHIAGANRLSRRLAAATGGTAVITTATDLRDIPAFDELAAVQGWRIVNRDAIKQVNSVLLQRKPIAFVGPEAPVKLWYGETYPLRILNAGAAIPDDVAAVVTLDHEPPRRLSVPILQLRTQPLIVGLGCRRGTSAKVIAEAVNSVLAAQGLDRGRIAGIATADAKRGDAGLSAYASENGLELTFFASRQLARVTVPTPSAMPDKHIGTASVAEAAALLRSGGRLLIPKHIHGGAVTVAVAVCPDPAPPDAVATETPAGLGRIYAVGIGSGAMQGMTLQAQRVLSDVEVVVGYKVYMEQVAPLVAGKRLLSSGMRREIARCTAAIDEAAAGHAVAVICSGDAGVYGMAGLILELLAARRDTPPIDVEIVPGVTAALTAAAALGAPLMNDYATISLSDLLTERRIILERLSAVAAVGMPCVLYNPRSRTRRELLSEALRRFRDANGDELACGVVRNAGREDQRVWMGPIRDLPEEDVDMFTTVIIGGRDSAIIGGRLVTRRGYPTREEE